MDPATLAVIGAVGVIVSTAAVAYCGWAARGRAATAEAKLAGYQIEHLEAALRESREVRARDKARWLKQAAKAREYFARLDSLDAAFSSDSARRERLLQFFPDEGNPPGSGNEAAAAGESSGEADTSTG